MHSYKRLTREDRYQIKVLLDNEFSIRAIAKALGREPSTISRELQRCSRQNYNPERAELKSKRLRKLQARRPIMTPELELRVHEFLELQLSPEQIAGRLRLENIQVSHETIYKHVYGESSPGKNLYKNLRRRRSKRRQRSKTCSRSQSGVRKDRTWIEEREAIVAERKRFGDLERDTIVGGGARLLTIVDRVSKMTWIKKIKMSAWNAHLATLELLDGETVRTITNDNGSEFELHDFTSKELSVPIYFSRPYCSWQRGTNENTNGLIRQYFPKGTDFETVTDDEVEEVEARLNNRPRKGLGYRTPIEVHENSVRVLR